LAQVDAGADTGAAQAVNSDVEAVDSDDANLAAAMAESKKINDEHSQKLDETKKQEDRELQEALSQSKDVSAKRKKVPPVSPSHPDAASSGLDRTGQSASAAEAYAARVLETQRRDQAADQRLEQQRLDDAAVLATASPPAAVEAAMRRFAAASADVDAFAAAPADGAPSAGLTIDRWQNAWKDSGAKMAPPPT